jgi:hypothetical protein
VNYTAFDCARCGAGSSALLSDEKEVHLRQCATCDGWLVIRERPANGDPDCQDALQVESLGIPPHCPVEGCEAVVSDNQLAEHVIATHGGSLN